MIGLGDADLFRQLLTELGVEGAERDGSSVRLAAHDLVGLEVELSELDGIGDEQVATCVALSQLRGGREVLDEARALGGAAVERATARIGETVEALEERGVADRVQIDLGLLRDLGYYSGAILEVYDPALGHVLGGGGRYDELLRRFGVDLPAAGFALYLERVHVAQMEEEPRGGSGRERRGRRDGPRQGRRAAEAGGAARRPARGDPRRARRGRHRHGEVRGESRSLIFEGEGSPW